MFRKNLPAGLRSMINPVRRPAAWNRVMTQMGSMALGAAPAFVKWLPRVAVALAVFETVPSAFAASQTWQGDVSTDWATTGNWVGIAVPGGGGGGTLQTDVATFNDANTVSTTVAAATNKGIGAFSITGTKSYTFNLALFYFENGNSGISFNNSSSGTITLNNTSTFRARRNGDTTFQNTGGLVTFNAPILNEDPTTPFDDTGDLIFDGTGNFQVTSLAKRRATQTTDLVKNGAGTLSITGFQTVFSATDTALTQSGLTNTTTINNGTIQITSGDARSLGHSPVDNLANWLTLNGGTFQVSTNNLDLGVNSTEGVSLGASGGSFNVDSDRTLTIGGAGGVNLISGGGALTKLGEGTLNLNAANTYSGATTISAGILAVNGSLDPASAVTVNGGTLQGSGSIGGSVTINGGATLAAGNSIESLAMGNLSLIANSIFAYELDKDAGASVAGDLTAVTGSLTLDSGDEAILTLTELSTIGSWDAGEKLTLISYTGAWNGGLFTYDSNVVADDSTLIFDGVQWMFNYNDTFAGTNYTGDLTGTNFVTMSVVAIPEPSTFALLGVGTLGLLHGLRRRRLAKQ